MKEQACSAADKASGVRNILNPLDSAQEWWGIAAAELDVKATEDVHLHPKDAENSSMLLWLTLPRGLVPLQGFGADAHFPSTAWGSPAASSLTAFRAGVREGFFIIYADSCSCTILNTDEKDIYPAQVTESITCHIKYAHHLSTAWPLLLSKMGISTLTKE